MLNLVDYFAVSFNIFILASIEVIGISWIYGTCLRVFFSNVIISLFVRFQGALQRYFERVSENLGYLSIASGIVH